MEMAIEEGILGAMPHFQQMECGLLAEEMEKRKLKNIQIVLIVIKRASRSKTVVWQGMSDRERGLASSF